MAYKLCGTSLGPREVIMIHTMANTEGHIYKDAETIWDAVRQFEFYQKKTNRWYDIKAKAIVYELLNKLKDKGLVKRKKYGNLNHYDLTNKGMLCYINNTKFFNDHIS